MDADRVLDGLNAEQRRAVTTDTTPLCILAGAGSGKTRVLTRRIAYRALTDQHDPRHVLALTFTRKAAGELGARLRQLGLRDQVAAGTFHAVAYSQLRSRWAERGIRAPDLLERKAGFVAPLITTPGSSGRPRRSLVFDVVTEIEWAKARALDPEQYFEEVQRLHRRPPLTQREMTAVFRRYEDAKREQRRVDFDDLLRLCRRDLLEDAAFAQAQRWRFQHVFVDEFQDVNPLQRGLLEAWVGGRDDLCVVGDPNQAIYGWNGADPTALVGFLDRYPAGEVVHLVENYRSSPQILAVANGVLDADDELRPNRGDGPRPTITSAPDDEAEALAVARAVRDHHGPGERWSSQAVLCRTNAQSPIIERALHRAAIPYRVRGGGRLLEHPDVQDMLAALQRHRGSFAVALADLDDPTPGLTADPDVDVDPDSLDEATGPSIAEAERAERRQAIRRLGLDFAAVDPNPTAGGFAAWLRASAGSDRPDQQGDAVEIATFHAAKGLEWPIVHLTGLEDGLVPIVHADDPAAQDEERRLFYVAVTRAERVLHLTWAETRTFGDRTVERTRSPYLDLVESTCLALERADAPATTARLPLPRSGAADLDPSGSATLDALKAWRGHQARVAAVPPHVIFQDRVLVEVAARRPSTPAELADVSGVGPNKARRFGEAILGIVAEHGAS